MKPLVLQPGIDGTSDVILAGGVFAPSAIAGGWAWNAGWTNVHTPNNWRVADDGSLTCQRPGLYHFAWSCVANSLNLNPVGGLFAAVFFVNPDQVGLERAQFIGDPLVYLLPIGAGGGVTTPGASVLVPVTNAALVEQGEINERAILFPADGADPTGTGANVACTITRLGTAQKL